MCQAKRGNGMTYNKETVVGVFKQCQDMLPKNSYDWETVEELIAMAKEGKFTKPTLEEVWKEKCEEAVKKKIYSFCFIYEGETYETSRFSVVWEHPEKVIFL
jgi:hypothetical protein